MSSTAGEFITEILEYDGGRQVTAYVPAAPAEAVVFAGDGQLITSWGGLLEAADLPPTMIIGAHRVEDETLRLHEYSPGRSTAAFAFDPQRFAAHEQFLRAAVKAQPDISLDELRLRIQAELGLRVSGSVLSRELTHLHLPRKKVDPRQRAGNRAGSGYPRHLCATRARPAGGAGR